MSTTDHDPTDDDATPSVGGTGSTVGEGEPDPASGFDSSILASTLHFGSGMPRRSSRRYIPDWEIEDIVLERRRGDGW
jgi:hypothetical protein